MAARGTRRGELRAVIDEFVYDDDRPPALRNVSLTARTGELVLVAGPSGSGKSTLALALAGLIPGRIGGAIWQGDVTWQEDGEDAVDLTVLPLHEAARHVGIVFQNPEFQLIQYQVDSEVAFGPENLNLPHDEVVERVERSLDKVGATSFASAAINSLSGGQKQRVAIAATLAMAPPMLVLDEPTSDLDPVGTDEVMQVLHRLCHEEGHGVVVVEHKLDEVAPYADRVLLVLDGTVVVDDHPRRAFVPTSRWRAAGVRPPELVTLSEAMPEHFDSVALTVEEAATALAGLEVPELPAAVAPPTPGGPALALDRVTVRFDAKVAVDDVSFQVGEGEWLALVGANGSGKTTMGATLMGFAKPAAGSATCFGRPVAFGKIPRQAVKLGYLFQNVDDMLFCESVADELEFTRRNHVPAGDDAPDPHDVARMIRLGDRLGSHPYALSGGQRQRLGLGALLTRAPRGLILDEPTTGLDEAHTAALFELLSKVRTTLGSLTCLLITHDMRLVARFADRVLAISEGRVLLSGTPRQVFAHPEVLERCGVRPPAIASLHVRIADRPPTEVATSAEEFVGLLHPAAARGGAHVAGD